MEVSGHQESLDISIYQNNFLNISQMKESQTGLELGTKFILVYPSFSVDFRGFKEHGYEKYELSIFFLLTI